MPSHLRQRERCIRYRPGHLVIGITFLILTGGISAGPGVFKLAFHERRGTSVEKVVNVSLTTCSILCHQDDICKCFNFFRSSGVCQLLSNWHLSTPDSTSQMYVEEDVINYFRDNYRCNTCEGDSWPIPGTVAQWGIDCLYPGYVRGIIASNSPPTLSFEYLRCRTNSFLVFDPESDGVVLADGASSDCVSAVGGPAALTAIWTNDISFYNQTNYAVLCRALISGSKVDNTDCAPPKMKHYIKFILQQEVSANFISYPDDMLAINIYRTIEGEWKLKCYDNCYGFNFRQSTGVCELLSNWFLSKPDSTSQMYVGEFGGSSSISKFTCNACEGDSWPIPGTVDRWGINCGYPRYARGIIAINSPPTFSFEYMRCNEHSFMLPDPESYGVVLPGGSSSDCVSALGGPAALTAIWTNDISFYNQTNYAVLCRPLISGCKVDNTDCALPTMRYTTRSYRGQDLLASFIYCPSDMLVVNIYRTLEGEWKLKCCRFYRIS